SFVVAKASTTTVLTALPRTSALGDPVTFTATVTSVAGVGIPAGTVTFVIDGSAATTYTSGLDAGGVASITRTDLTEGSHTIVATYNGDANFDVSSDTTTQTVLKASTTVLTSSQNPSVYGQAVIFTGNVTAASGTPTGTLTLQVDNNPTVMVVFSGTPVDFPAVQPAQLSVGSHTVTLTYSGDSNF